MIRRVQLLGISIMYAYIALSVLTEDVGTALFLRRIGIEPEFYATLTTIVAVFIAISAYRDWRFNIILSLPFVYYTLATLAASVYDQNVPMVAAVIYTWAVSVIIGYALDDMRELWLK